MTLTLSLMAVLVIGLLMFCLTTTGSKICRIGEIMFFCALLALLFTFGSVVSHVSVH